MAPPVNDPRPHAVYRCYDASDRLLYIGCSADLAKRFAHHESTVAWVAFAVRIDVEWVGPKITALRKERAEIIERVPLFNRLPRETVPRGSADPPGGWTVRGSAYLLEHARPGVDLTVPNGRRRARIVRTDAVARVRGVAPQPWPEHG